MIGEELSEADNACFECGLDDCHEWSRDCELRKIAAVHGNKRKSSKVLIQHTCGFSRIVD